MRGRDGGARGCMDTGAQVSVMVRFVCPLPPVGLLGRPDPVVRGHFSFIGQLARLTAVVSVPAGRASTAHTSPHSYLRRVRSPEDDRATTATELIDRGSPCLGDTKLPLALGATRHAALSAAEAGGIAVRSQFPIQPALRPVKRSLAEPARDGLASPYPALVARIRAEPPPPPRGICGEALAAERAFRFPGLKRPVVVDDDFGTRVGLVTAQASMEFGSLDIVAPDYSGGSVEYEFRHVVEVAALEAATVENEPNAKRLLSIRPQTAERGLQRPAHCILSRRRTGRVVRLHFAVARRELGAGLGNRFAGDGAMHDNA